MCKFLSNLQLVYLHSSHRRQHRRHPDPHHRAAADQRGSGPYPDHPLAPCNRDQKVEDRALQQKHILFTVLRSLSVFYRLQFFFFFAGCRFYYFFNIFLTTSPQWIPVSFAEPVLFVLAVPCFSPGSNQNLSSLLQKQCCGSGIIYFIPDLDPSLNFLSSGSGSNLY